MTAMRCFALTMFLAAIGAAAAYAASKNAAPADSLAGRVPGASYARASWTSDRLPLRVGDIVTVVVDEQTAAREKVSNVATGDRSQRAGLRFSNSSATSSTTQDVQFNTGVASGSRDIGEANREGDLTAVLSVRVTAIEPNGVARIEGGKKVTVDGRLQDVTLSGAIRSEDVEPSNLLRSCRIAEAVITYKGKKIGPRTGIAGKILSILWP